MDGALLWALANDLQPVIQKSDGCKTLKLVCEIIFDAFQKSVPDIKIEHHKTAPKTAHDEA